MFTALSLREFKSWENTGTIDLKPVSLVLGTNSSGKSSLIQSLLMLKQTEQSPDRAVHLNLGGDEQNDLFDFGDFDDVLRKGIKGDRRFEIALEFSTPNPESRVPKGRFNCIYSQDSSRAVVVNEWTLGTNTKIFQSIRRKRGAYSIVVDDNVSSPVCKGREYAPQRSVGLPPEAIAALGMDGALVEDLSLLLRRELQSISYLGPLRRKPERDYTWNKTLPGAIENDGNRAIDVLLANSQLKNGDHNNIIHGVSKWLAKMNIADSLEVKQVGRSARYEVVISKNGIQSNLRDVGIGVSQVLPVLTLAYFAPEGTTIILEEPEIHLHPLAQSVLAELFVEISQERNVQFIVETHSEHLFRRMQTLIARQTFDIEQVAMYFVENLDGNAQLRTLDVDDFGRVHNWPDGFFGDALGETREQTKLAIKRAKALREKEHGHISG